MGADEVQIRIGADPTRNRVILEFCTPVKWAALPPHEAVALAAAIIEHAMRLLPQSAGEVEVGVESLEAAREG